MWSPHAVHWSLLESTGLHMDSVGEGKVLLYPDLNYTKSNDKITNITLKYNATDSAGLQIQSARLCQTLGKIRGGE